MMTLRILGCILGGIALLSGMWSLGCSNSGVEPPNGDLPKHRTQPFTPVSADDVLRDPLAFIGVSIEVRGTLRRGHRTSAPPCIPQGGSNPQLEFPDQVFPMPTFRSINELPVVAVRGDVLTDSPQFFPHEIGTVLVARGAVRETTWTDPCSRDRTLRTFSLAIDDVAANLVAP